MQHLDPVRRWILSIQIHANQHVEIVQRPVQAKWEGEGRFVQVCVLRRLHVRGVHEFWHKLFDEPVSDEPLVFCVARLSEDAETNLVWTL